MKSARWPKIRAAGQLLFWLAFVFIIINLRFPVEHDALHTFIPRLSLHLGIASSLAAGKLLAEFYPALIVLLLTFVFGRFFCGWVCPLGATIDASDRVTGASKKTSGKTSGTPAFAHYKYVVLLVSLVAALIGIQLAGIMDPLSLAMRSYIIVVYSWFDFLAKMVFNSLYGIPLVNVVSEPVFSFLKKSALDFNPISFSGHLPVLFIFLIIFALSRIARRFWCRALCPLGAVYALTSHFSIFRRKVDKNLCVHCGDCVSVCRTSAISADGLGTRESECVRCFDCLSSCRYDAVSFTFANPFARKKNDDDERLPAAAAFPLTRRDMLTGLATCAVITPAFAIDTSYRENHTYLVRPPGYGSEESLLDTCVRCGACMKVCPTNALHPAVLEAGLEGIFTPRLIPRLGWCEMNCVLCTRVCPSGALRKLEPREKETTIIGTAHIARDLCIPWSRGRECLVCEEMCPTPTKAIILREETVVNGEGQRLRVKLPYVREDVCVGCGICENKCPVTGSAAIRVRTPRTDIIHGPSGGHSPYGT